MNTEEHERIIEEEKSRYKEFKDLVENNTELFKYLWNIGDGDGGHIFNSIREAVTGEYFKTYKAKSYVKKKVTHALQKTVFERDKYRCVMCYTHLNLTVDHIHPEILGGTLDISNLQTLCKSCNSKKGVNI